MISTGEIKRGITVEIDGQLYQIMEFQHIKMGRGSAQVRMKLRNVRKGDTATGATKPATMESGLKVNVPLFVNTGDRIKVDTRSGEYLERA